MAKEFFAESKVRSLAFHFRASSAVAEAQVIIWAASKLPASADKEVIDSILYGLGRQAGNANRDSIAFPAQRLGALNDFIKANFADAQEGRIIRIH